MFGIGSTVGTGIFFVLSEAVPQAGPGVIVSFIIAGIAAGLAAICYAELASAVPVSGSTYSYAYTTLGEMVAMGVAACLLLEYVVSTAAVSVGWSQYVNKLLDNFLGYSLPQALSAAPWDSTPGVFNVPAAILVALCAPASPRGQRVGRGQHRHGDHQTRRSGDVRRDRVLGIQCRPVRELRALRRGRNRIGRGHHLLLLHRP
jgi:amino acid transporter